MSSDQESLTGSPSSNVQLDSLQLRQLPPRPERGGKERSLFPAAEILAQYPHFTLEQKKNRLRFCKEKIECCRAMLKRAVKYLNFNVDKNSDIARYNLFTACVSGVVKHVISEEDADKTRKDANRAMGILDDMEGLKDVSLHELEFVHDMYSRIEDGSHGNGDEHWDDCEYII